MKTIATKPQSFSALTGGAAPAAPLASSPLSVLWYGLMLKPWTTLGMVSPDDPNGAWALAQALVETAALPSDVLKAVSVLDATPGRAEAISRAVAPSKVQASGQRARFVLATDSPLSNPVALGVLASCDAVLLVVHAGKSLLPLAR
ncbi:MAG TPA: hypothetical protein VFN91_12110, partial [Myxococcaceae bacterium]|nr:hypothetical protein [Myxococcaceae bacterium]